MMITFKGNNKNAESNGYYCSTIKSAISSKTLNGEYTGEIILPLSALKDKEIKNRVKKDMYVKMGGQLFKIVEHDKTLKNIIIYLVHITDELRDTVPVQAGYKSSGTISATFALDKLKQNTQQLPFILLNYCTSKAAYEVKHSNILDNIMGQDGFLESFKCEMSRDNYKIIFRDIIGSDKGVKAVYRRNLKGIKVKSSSKDVITKIYPMSRDGIIINPYFSDRANTGKTVERFVEFDTEVKEARNFTTQDGENVVIPAKTEGDVRRELAEYAKAWFKLTDADIPKLQIEVNLILLENTEEYKHLRGLERVNLGDYVTVTENPTETTAKLRVIKINKDELNDKNVSITLSSTDKEFNYKSDAKAIESALKQANKLIQQEKDMLAEEIEMRFQHSSNLIKTALGGHVHKRDGELLIMDTDDPATATKVWRWNLNGLGYSSNGVDGDYRLAMTMDGAINADFITAGVLTGNVIRAGLIKGQYVEINNSTTFAEGYNPTDKADKTELEAGMKSIKQEFTLKDNQLKSEITGIDANNNEKISRLIQTINGLNYMVSGVEESLITVSPTNDDDLIVDIGAFKPIVPNMINSVNYKAVLEVIKTDRKSIDSIYNSLNANPNLLGTTKTDLTSYYNTYVQRYDNLANKIEAIDPKVGVSPTDNFPLYLYYYRTALSSLTTQIEKARQYVEDFKNSKIRTEYKADITATKKEFNSEYTKITTQISGVDGKVNKLSTDVSNINQKADNITLSVLKTQGDVNLNKSEIAKIDVKANNINLSVNELGSSLNDKVPKDRVLTYINLSKEAAKIKADLIDLDGYVRATQLATGGYGVDPDRVNNGQLTGNTVKTSTSSSNYIHMREQYLRFYNGGLNKMELGFSTQGGTSVQFPYIMMGAGDGYGGNKMQIAKWTNGAEIRYRPSGYNSWMGSYGIKFENDGLFATDHAGNYTSLSKLLYRAYPIKEGIDITSNGGTKLSFDGTSLYYKNWNTEWQSLSSMFDNYVGYTDGYEFTSPNGRYGFKVTNNGVYVKMFGIWTDFEHIIT